MCVSNVQLAGAAEMHVWGETLEAAARLPAVQAPSTLGSTGAGGGDGGKRGSRVGTSGLLAGVTLTSEDDGDEVVDLPAMLLQPKSATSLPLDLAGLPKSGQFTFEVEQETGEGTGLAVNRYPLKHRFLKCFVLALVLFSWLTFFYPSFLPGAPGEPCGRVCLRTAARGGGRGHGRGGRGLQGQAQPPAGDKTHSD